MDKVFITLKLTGRKLQNMTLLVLLNKYNLISILNECSDLLLLEGNIIYFVNR